MILDEWARTWCVTHDAMNDLRSRLMGMDGSALPEPGVGTSEAAVQAATRVRASRLGMRVFRNNVGVLEDERGVPVRYGLANDSPQVNAICKSADLIGIRARIVTPDLIGQTIGQFVSFECKHRGWIFGNTERERAQANWAALVLSMGGDARFVSDPGQI